MDDPAPMSDPIQVKIPLDVLELMDTEIKKRRFRSRPAFIRAAIEAYLGYGEQQEKEKFFSYMREWINDPENRKLMRQK